MHFKLIISVYQDKVERMKAGEGVLVAKAEEGSLGDDEEGKIVDYFRS